MLATGAGLAHPRECSWLPPGASLGSDDPRCPGRPMVPARSGTPKHSPQERRLPRLRLPPLLQQRQAPGLACGVDAFGVGVPSPAGVALRRDQHVARHGVQVVATQRAAIGRRLHVPRRANRPPACLVQLRHRTESCPQSSSVPGVLALVTGGGRGIGANVARKLADDGWEVVVAARTREQVEAVADEIGGRARRARRHRSRGRSSAQSTRRARSTCSSRTRASANRDGATWEIEPDDWWRTFEVNVLGVHLCCRAVIPGMLERGRAGS